MSSSSLLSLLSCPSTVLLSIKLVDVYNEQMINQDRNSQRLLIIQPSETTEITDYENDPHIYNNVWEYIFSIVGMTVGFGSFWRFPYLIYKNGGGVFLVPYFISIIVVGIPLLYLETAVGQMHRLSIPFVLKRIHPCLKMIGIAFLLNSLHLCSVYNILMTYSYRFIFTAFKVDLPFTSEPITENTYFKQTILQQSDSIEQFEAINPWLFILYVASLLISHYIVRNGVKASGKIVTVTATAPFILLFILMVRAFFLNGSQKGLQYLFEPKWEKIWQGQIWIDALIQVFYQFGVGIGTIMCVCCLNPRRQDLMHGVFYVPLGLITCGFLSAITIFLYLAHFCEEMGVPIDHPSLALGGPELSFNVLPKALAMLPMPNLWIFVFFITMVLLGIDSFFGMLEGLYTYLRDEFKLGTVQIFGIEISQQAGKYIILLLIMIGCPSLTSHAGIYYLQFYDYFISNIPFLLAAIVEIYIFVYLFKFQQLEKNIIRYTGKPTPFIIRFFLQSKLLVFLLGINLLIAVFQQLCMLRKYDFFFYLFGWAISTYPSVLSYLYLRSKWTSISDLRLTFDQIDHPPTFL